MSAKWLKHRLWNTIMFKVFGLTVAVLLLFSVCTYLVIYTLLPHTYTTYKQNQIDSGIDSFIDKSATLPNDEAVKALTKLQEQTNAFIMIKDESQQMLYPYIQTAVAQITKPSTLTPVTSQFLNSQTLSAGAIPIKTLSAKAPQTARTLTYNGEKAYLTAYFTPQPIDEASKVLVLLSPYVALFILIAAVGASYFYSVIITRPIRKITVSASRMAQLQLDTRIPVHSSDEIGGLAASLNSMAANLQESISELKMSNEQLQQEMIREREVEARRRELFSAISHELKSPLTIMKGQLEGMLYKIGIYADRDAYLYKTLQVAEEMETLIADILRVARSDDWALSKSDENVSLRGMVDGLMAKYKELGLQRGVALHSSVHEASRIRTDGGLLEKAMSNIVHNAIIYTNPGNKVVVSEAEEPGCRMIEIVNTGAHIDEMQIGRIFEPFYRLEQSRSRNTGGSGLGLYITKRILQQLGIDIQVRNTDEGVVFSLIFLQNASKAHPVSIQTPDKRAKLIDVRHILS